MNFKLMTQKVQCLLLSKIHIICPRSGVEEKIVMLFVQNLKPCFRSTDFHHCSLPIGYPILSQHPMSAISQPFADPMGCGLSSSPAVNGIPAPGSFHPIRINSRTECVVCQMKYKRCDRQTTLPCKHAYHSACVTKWLRINKASPICLVEVCIEEEPKN